MSVDRYNIYHKYYRYQCTRMSIINILFKEKMDNIFRNGIPYSSIANKCAGHKKPPQKTLPPNNNNNPPIKNSNNNYWNKYNNSCQCQIL